VLRLSLSGSRSQRASLDPDHRRQKNAQTYHTICTNSSYQKMVAVWNKITSCYRKSWTT
jgi:hypothetical protein